jgi:hypothetical protein
VSQTSRLIVLANLRLGKNFLRLFGNRRGSTKIWECVGGAAAYTLPNLEIMKVNPNAPR